MRTLDDLLKRVVVCMSGCWLWTGADSGNGRGGGYAKVSKTIDGVEKWFYVHRYVFELFKGPIPEGYEIDHICKHWGWIPFIHRRCVNPDHLEAVPPSENQRRNFR